MNLRLFLSFRNGLSDIQTSELKYDLLCSIKAWKCKQSIENKELSTERFLRITDVYIGNRGLRRIFPSQENFKLWTCLSDCTMLQEMLQES